MKIRSTVPRDKTGFLENGAVCMKIKAQNVAQSLPPAEKKPCNIFATIDKPDTVRPDKYHPRYTPKVRYEPTKEQAPPPISHQHVLKPWKQLPEKPSCP
ncbi:hypothetical protein BGZ58_004217, partial [Dissophora ornata]